MTWHHPALAKAALSESDQEIVALKGRIAGDQVRIAAARNQIVGMSAEIDRLRSERAALRRALSKIANGWGGTREFANELARVAFEQEAKP